MEISSLPKKVDASEVPFQNLASNSRLSEKEKIGEVCRQFEAVLLKQILHDARKAVLDPQQNQNASTLEIYADMINNQLADSISHSGMFGLANSLQGQLTVQSVSKVNESKDSNLKISE